MKIAITGYGRMGKKIEEVAQTRGHNIACIIDNENDWNEKEDILTGCDIVIDFSLPEVVVSNIIRCHTLNLPVVTGTTGWETKREEIIKQIKENGKTLFFAPNFSIGVNILFELNRKLTELINPHKQYRAKIEETHHIHKKDAPSGTAITLAKDLINRHHKYESWVKKENNIDSQLTVISERKEEVTGDHTITWDSDVDLLTISHHAKNRNGFALGAVIAAEWVKDKKGYFEMRDMLF
ncbi:MAG: 4-hydroxy-tetrahydrodipicolinate reductase [Bacteroidales bacterium]|nr:4-hydroxy-tetrahydrodipicolinate reductase [Bacteroidales bacterium]